MIGFPLIIADSERDMPGFEPGPDRLGAGHKSSNNRSIRSKTLHEEEKYKPISPCNMYYDD